MCLMLIVMFPPGNAFRGTFSSYPNNNIRVILLTIPETILLIGSQVRGRDFPKPAPPVRGLFLLKI